MVTGRWVTIALTASLAVNIFLAGLFVGHEVGGPRFLFRAAVQRPVWHPGDGGLPPFVQRIADRMSPPYRDILMSKMKQHQPEIAAAGVALREARGKLRQIVTAENFDRAAADATAAELRDRMLQFQQTLQAALLDVAAALPAEGRRQMIEPLRRGAPER